MVEGCVIVLIYVELVRAEFCNLGLDDFDLRAVNYCLDIRHIVNKCMDVVTETNIKLGLMSNRLYFYVYVCVMAMTCLQVC